MAKVGFRLIKVHLMKQWELLVTRLFHQVLVYWFQYLLHIYSWRWLFYFCSINSSRPYFVSYFYKEVQAECVLIIYSWLFSLDEPSNILEKFTPSLMGWYRQPTYHSHEIARVLANPSRHYGGVQWVFSPPVHSLASVSTHWIPFVSKNKMQRGLG